MKGFYKCIHAYTNGDVIMIRTGTQATSCVLKTLRKCQKAYLPHNYIYLYMEYNSNTNM